LFAACVQSRTRLIHPAIPTITLTWAARPAMSATELCPASWRSIGTWRNTWALFGAKSVIGLLDQKLYWRRTRRPWNVGKNLINYQRNFKNDENYACSYFIFWYQPPFPVEYCLYYSICNVFVTELKNSTAPYHFHYKISPGKSEKHISIAWFNGWISVLRTTSKNLKRGLRQITVNYATPASVVHRLHTSHILKSSKVWLSGGEIWLL